MDLDIMPQHSIILGNYNNSYFETEILLYFSQKDYVGYYFEKFKNELNSAKNFDFGSKIEIDLIKIAVKKRNAIKKNK